MTRLRRRYCQGAFLLESLIAVVILSVGLTAIIRAFSLGLEAYRRSQDYQNAAVVLENILTDLLVKRYVGDTTAMDGQCAEPFENYRCAIDVLDAGMKGPLEEVRVSVFWDEGKNKRSLKAETYLFKDPSGRG